MEIKGIIFDGDGVLFDTEKLHVIAWKRVFAGYKISLSKRDFEKGIGVADNIFLKDLEKEGKVPEGIDKDEMIEKKTDELLKILEEKNIKISKGIIKILNFLKKDFKIALASNSEKRFVLKILENSGISNFFDAIVTRNDVKFPKPSPEIYLTVCKKLDIKPENMIVFEDSETGIIAAKKAKILCIGVLSTCDFEKIKMADIIIERLNMKNVKNVLKILQEK